MKLPFSLKQLAFWVAMVLPSSLSAASLPLTDLILYGKVYQKTTNTPVTGTLPGPVSVKINFAGDAQSAQPRPTVISSTAELLDAGSGTKAFYVIRLRRFEVGTARVEGDTFVMPGDRIHVYLNGFEVSETESPIVLATDAVQDIRLLALNAPPGLLDTDGDGLPDSWEQQFFGSLTQGPNDDQNKDGVKNLIALFGGLDPNQNNTSRMPVLQLEQGGSLVFYFRQSTSTTGLTYTVEGSDSLLGSGWLPIPNLTPTVAGTEGTSRILKVTIPSGVDRSRRFFRLAVSQ